MRKPLNTDDRATLTAMQNPGEYTADTLADRLNFAHSRTMRSLQRLLHARKITVRAVGGVQYWKART